MPPQDPWLRRWLERKLGVRDATDVQRRPVPKRTSGEVRNADYFPTASRWEKWRAGVLEGLTFAPGAEIPASLGAALSKALQGDKLGAAGYAASALPFVFGTTGRKAAEQVGEVLKRQPQLDIVAGVGHPSEEQAVAKALRGLTPEGLAQRLTHGLDLPDGARAYLNLREAPGGFDGTLRVEVKSKPAYRLSFGLQNGTMRVEHASVAKRYAGRKIGRTSVQNLLDAAPDLGAQKATLSYAGDISRHVWPQLGFDEKGVRSLAAEHLKNYLDPYELAERAKGGFSVQPSTGKFLGKGTKGYAVALAGDVPPVLSIKDPTANDLAAYLKQHDAFFKQNPNALLGSWTDANGVTHIEASELVPDRDQAVKLGRERKQQAIWDFDTMSEIAMPSPARAVAPDSVALTALTHYSQKKGLKSLDPAFMGTGRTGAEGRRTDRPPALHAYLKGTKPEREFARDQAYDFTLPTDRIYDLSKDPDGLVRKYGANPSEMERQILKRYDGFVSPERGIVKFGKKVDLPDIVGDSVVSKAVQGAISGAPAVHTRDKWKPTSRGIFDREAPKIQGLMPSDPRLVIPEPTGKERPSELLEAIVDSKTIRRGLDSRVVKGLLMGGPEWYELGPLKADLESRPGAMSFQEFNAIGAGASPQNPVPSEIAAMTIINWANKRGVSLDEAVREYLKTSDKKPLLSRGHQNLGLGGIERGVILPSDLKGEAWKVPNYYDGRMGGGGVLDVDAPGGLPALDTHERRDMWQLMSENPRLRQLAKRTGVWDAALKEAGDDARKVPRLPFRNAQDYKLAGSLYVDGARRFDLPTSRAYQASRWVGGWDKTGLQSPPTGDFLQILEDVITWTAQQRGVEPRKLWDRVAKGDDFLSAYTGRGHVPVK